MIKSLIETHNVRNAFLHRFEEVAITNKAPSRFRLIFNLIDILNINNLKEAKIKDQILEEFIDSHLFRVNQLIIKNDDFELFQKELNNLAILLSIEYPEELQSRISGQLYYTEFIDLFRNEIDEFIKRRKDFDVTIKVDTTKSFKKIKKLNDEIDYYEKKLWSQ